MIDRSDQRLFLLELGRRGHQRVYLRLVLDMLMNAQLGYSQVVIVTWRANLQDPPPGMHFVALDDCGDSDLGGFCWSVLRKQQCTSSDTVLLMEGDRVLSLPLRIAFSSRARCAFLWFRPNFFAEALAVGSVRYRLRTVIKWILIPVLAMLRRRIRVGYIDAWNWRRSKQFGVASFLVPDPVPRSFREHISRARLMPARHKGDGIVVLSIGHLDERKGVFEVLQALRSQRDIATVRYRVVGRGTDLFTERFRASMTEMQKCGVIVERIAERLTDEDFVSEIVSADAVMVNYTQFLASSAVLNLAIAANKVAIGYNVGVIGRTLRDYPKGIGVEYRSARELRTAILSVTPNTSETDFESDGDMTVPGEEGFCRGLQTLLRSGSWK